MSVSINIFFLLNIFLIACSAPNFMHHSQCHKVISIINVTLEFIRSFRTAVCNHQYTVSLITLRFLFNPSTPACSKHPSMKIVRGGIKRGWTIVVPSKMYTVTYATFIVQKLKHSTFYTILRLLYFINIVQTSLTSYCLKCLANHVECHKLLSFLHSWI